MLIFWGGLTRAPINEEFIISPIIYFIAIFITMAISYIYSKKSFKRCTGQINFYGLSFSWKYRKSWYSFGNCTIWRSFCSIYFYFKYCKYLFFIYIFSVYFFAGDKFSFKDALKEIFKIPAIWFAILAISFNYYGFELSEDFDKVFTMGGAYAAIVMQLVIFGVFMSQIKIKTANWNLSLNIVLFKHVILPMVGLFVIVYFNLDPFVSSIIFLELIVPLAVNNVNLSALYNCKPIDTTFSVLISTLSFVLFIYFYILIIEKFFGV